MIFLANFFEVEVNSFIVFLSIAFGILPDIDAPIQLLKTGNLHEGGFHRKYTHFPIIYLPIAIVIYIVWGGFFSLLFLINIISHFLHDTIGTGWGIAWLWPFNRKLYKYFRNPMNRKKSLTFFTSWNHEEVIVHNRKYGNKNWIKEYYFSLHPILIIEVLVLFIGLLLLYLTIR